MKWEWRLSVAADDGHRTTSIAFFVRAMSGRRSKTLFRIRFLAEKKSEAIELAEKIVSALNQYSEETTALVQEIY